MGGPEPGCHPFASADGAGETNQPPRIRLTERWHVPLDMEVISPAALAAKRVPVV